MANPQTTEILNALNSSDLKTQAPTLYDVLRQLTLATDSASNIALSQQSAVGDDPSMTGENVTNLVATVTSAGIVLSWDFMCGENQICSGISFEIRQGGDWNSAAFVTRTQANSVLLPPQPAGIANFLIKGYSGKGVYSGAATSVKITVSAPSAPGLAINQIGFGQYLDYVITPPSGSFAINYYVIIRDGVVIGLPKYPFFVYKELALGQHVYSVFAIDIAGNVGVQTDVVKSINYTPVPYYNSLVSSFAYDAINCTTQKGILYIGVPYQAINDETYQFHFSSRGWASPQAQVNAGFIHFIDPLEYYSYADHFTRNGWTSPQDQINAGYPIFCQPTFSPASYQETFDFGFAFNNVYVNVTYNELRFNQTPMFVQVKIEASPDNSTWTVWTTNSPSVFIFGGTSPRYIRVTLTFTLPNSWTLWGISNLTVGVGFTFNYKESGVAAAVSTDGSGTFVPFARGTTDEILTVTVSPASNQVGWAAEWHSSPTADGIFIFLFDQNGNRISGNVNWAMTANYIA